jgi:catechol 2,3-dioxygenase-like lactoylglutathione lyase family enzyme
MSDKPIPQPNCPSSLRVKDHVPMAHVNNVDQSIEFYTLLGFRCDSRFSDENGQTYYAAMRSDQAEIMLTRASGPVDSAQQAVLFYMYADDVQGLRKHLLDSGLVDAGRVPGERKMGDPDKPIPVGMAVFDITHPFYMKEGEVRVHDPDGYVILIGQMERRRTGSGSVAQIAITVSDVASATQFYREIIGLRFLFSAGPNFAFLSDGALRIMLSTPQGAGKVGANSILYFKVDDIERAFAAMIEKGAGLERPPQMATQMPDHQLWIGFLRDPDSNLVGIMEEKR